jgi:hypothetical protein
MKLRICIAFLVGVAACIATTASASRFTHFYTLGINDSATVPVVGANCVVGLTPEAYRRTLQNRYALLCYQIKYHTKVQSLGVAFSDSGIVVAMRHRSQPLYQRSNP